VAERRRRWLTLLAPLVLTAGCGETTDAPSPGAGLDVDSTWTWQLTGDVDTTIDADVYDIDLFDVPDATIDGLHADGRLVVCYFSAGSSEDWRPDAGAFDPADLGRPLDGWAGERWLDVRSPNVWTVIESRLDLAVERGCDGVEPDNVDGASNDTGFALTDDDQLSFLRSLAGAAHARGLVIALKNALDHVPDVVDEFDLAVVEQCHEYDECEAALPFVEAGKPVFVAEYDQRFVEDPALVCEPSRRLDLRTLILPLDLDGSFRTACDDL
jgi:hypothetical protein